MPVPTGPILRQQTAIVGQFPSADSGGFRILNVFNTESRLTITESVGQLANSVVPSADSIADPSSDLDRIGVWVLASSL